MTHKPQLALQLYTVREALEQDFSGTLTRVRELGFTHVETAFFPEGVTVQQAADAIRSAGLNVCSAHCALPLGDEKEPVLEMVELFDCDTVVWHGWPQDEDYGTVAGVQRLAERYNRAHEIVAAEGKHFGIHNHWWEFQSVDGQRPYRILADEMHPDIFFELDLYWVQTGGPDAAQVLRELGPRAPLLHLKDGPLTPLDDMVALGQGQMDYPVILCEMSDAVEWLIIELDRCATNMFEAVAESRRYLINNEFVSPS